MISEDLDFNFYEARQALSKSEFMEMTTLMGLTKLAPISMQQYNRLENLFLKVLKYIKEKNTND